MRRNAATLNRNMLVCESSREHFALIAQSGRALVYGGEYVRFNRFFSRAAVNKGSQVRIL